MSSRCITCIFGSKTSSGGSKRSVCHCARVRPGASFGDAGRKENRHTTASCACGHDHKLGTFCPKDGPSAKDSGPGKTFVASRRGALQVKRTCHYEVNHEVQWHPGTLTHLNPDGAISRRPSGECPYLHEYDSRGPARCHQLSPCESAWRRITWLP